jgi:hypothetical protein
VFLLHFEDWDPEFKRPKLQLISACHPAIDHVTSFLKFFFSPLHFTIEADSSWISQASIEMDSTAIYVGAKSALVTDGDLRWRLAACERHVYMTYIVPAVLRWAWYDFATGKFLAPAFDRPPELPELSRWMPTDSKKTWDDLPYGKAVEKDLRPLHQEAGLPDSVLVYQYA